MQCQQHSLTQFKFLRVSLLSQVKILKVGLLSRRLAQGSPVLPRLPLHEDRNLATLVGHMRREPEPALPSTSIESLLEGIMKPLRSLPLDPLLLE